MYAVERVRQKEVLTMWCEEIVGSSCTSAPRSSSWSSCTSAPRSSSESSCASAPSSSSPSCTAAPSSSRRRRARREEPTDADSGHRYSPWLDAARRSELRRSEISAGAEEGAAQEVHHYIQALGRTDRELQWCGDQGSTPSRCGSECTRAGSSSNAGMPRSLSRISSRPSEQECRACSTGRSSLQFGEWRRSTAQLVSIAPKQHADCAHRDDSRMCRAWAHYRDTWG